VVKLSPCVAFDLLPQTFLRGVAMTKLQIESDVASELVTDKDDIAELENQIKTGISRLSSLQAEMAEAKRQIEEKRGSYKAKLSKLPKALQRLIGTEESEPAPVAKSRMTEEEKVNWAIGIINQNGGSMKLTELNQAYRDATGKQTGPLMAALKEYEDFKISGNSRARIIAIA